MRAHATRVPKVCAQQKWLYTLIVITLIRGAKLLELNTAGLGRLGGLQDEVVVVGGGVTTLTPLLPHFAH